MSSFIWTDEYATHIFEIDVQHKTLFRMVSELENAMRTGKGKLTLGKLLKDLVYYTKSHFETEERFMQEHAFPGYEEHAGKHKKMALKVADIHNKFDSGVTHISIDVMKFLQNWLSEHILKTDMKFGEFINR